MEHDQQNLHMLGPRKCHAHLCTQMKQTKRWEDLGTNGQFKLSYEPSSVT
jgi:hypothetical protein